MSRLLDCHAERSPWFNSTVTNSKLRKAMTSESLKKRTNNQFLPKVMTYLQHL